MKPAIVLMLISLILHSVPATADDVARPPKMDARLGFSLPFWNLTATTQTADNVTISTNQPIIFPAVETRFALHLRQLFVLEIDSYLFVNSRTLNADYADKSESEVPPADLVSASHIRAGAMLSSARKQMPQRGWTRDGALTAGYGLVYQRVEIGSVYYDEPQTPYSDTAVVTASTVNHCLSFSFRISSTYWVRRAGVFLELYTNYDVSLAETEPIFGITPDVSADTMPDRAPEQLQMIRFGFAGGVAFR